MTDEELADVEANADDPVGTPGRIRYLVGELRRLRALLTLQIVAEREMEREACAKLVEAMPDRPGQGLDPSEAAEAIRARGEK